MKKLHRNLLFGTLFLSAVSGGPLQAGAAWVGSTRERFTPKGLSRPKIIVPALPETVALDVDRDGDLDLVQLPSAGRSRSLSVLLRRADGKLGKKWKADLSHISSQAPDRVAAARLTDSAAPSLVVQFPGPPYLVVFRSRRPGTFERTPRRLQAFFPSPLYRPGRRSEPYLKLAGVLDWNGDGFEDLIVELRDAKARAEGAPRRHSLFALLGGPSFPERATELVDLLQLAPSTRVWKLRDFDGDGTIEILLFLERARAGSIQVGELLFLRKAGGLLQEATWGIGNTEISPPGEFDLNTDGIPDLFGAFLKQPEYLVLLSQRRSDRGFTYKLRRHAGGPGAYSPSAGGVLLRGCDLNGDRAADILCAATDHNQLQILFARTKNDFSIVSAFLPLLPQAPPKGAWFRKVLWFGDLDGDGQAELAAATNEPLNPRYVPPEPQSSLSGPESAVMPIVRTGDEKNRYAPYYRLLIYRIDGHAIALTAVYNTLLSAEGYTLRRIRTGDPDLDGVNELVVETESLRTGRRAQAVFEIQEPLPRKPIATTPLGPTESPAGKGSSSP